MNDPLDKLFADVAAANAQQLDALIQVGLEDPRPELLIIDPRPQRVRVIVEPGMKPVEPSESLLVRWSRDGGFRSYAYVLLGERNPDLFNRLMRARRATSPNTRDNPCLN